MPKISPRSSDPGPADAECRPGHRRVPVTFRSADAEDIARTPPDRFARGTLDRAADAARATGPARGTAAGHSIRAASRPGTTGTFGGPIAVRAAGRGSRVTCSYHTPGLTSGPVVSGPALATLLAVAIGGALRTRTCRSSTGKH